MEIQIGGLIGLYGGALIGLIGWLYGRLMAKKQRGLDEIHNYIWQKTRSYSWYVTLITIYILFSLHIFGITLSVAAVLGILLLVHLGSWGIIGIIFSVFMYSEREIKLSGLYIGTGIIIVSTILFIILAILMEYWLYLLMSIPFSIVGYLFIKQGKKYKI